MSDLPSVATSPGRVGIAPLALSRGVRRVAMLSLASPFVLAILELVAHPWPALEWIEIWKTSLLAGPGMAIVLGLVGMLLASWRWARPGSLRVDGRELVMARDDGQRSFPLVSLRSGVVVPDGFGRAARVEIELPLGDQLFAEVADVAEGERLLAAAGIDAAQRACSVPLVAPAAAAFRRGIAIAGAIFFMFLSMGYLLVAVGPIPNTFVPVWLFTTVAVAALAARVTRPKSITIGADGLVIPGPMRDRFVPFADIAGVHARGTSVVIARRDGQPPIVRSADGAAARSIALRVKEAMESPSGAPAAQARLELLERGGRSLAAWREAAAHLVQRAGDYRAAGFAEDDLAAVLASADASAERRIGAALALAATGDDAHRERVRIAASACASPHMRIALERIAGGDADDQAVEEALAAETEQAARAGR